VNKAIRNISATSCVLTVLLAVPSLLSAQIPTPTPRGGIPGIAAHEGQALYLQASVSNALLETPELMLLPISATVHVPLWRPAAAVVTVLGGSTTIPSSIRALGQTTNTLLTTLRTTAWNAQPRPRRRDAMVTVVTHVPLKGGTEREWDAVMLERITAAKKQLGWVGGQLLRSSNGRVIVGTWQTRNDWAGWHTAPEFADSAPARWPRWRTNRAGLAGREDVANQTHFEATLKG
jgi:heme-degrading monooxygenase HmoA